MRQRGSTERLTREGSPLRLFVVFEETSFPQDRAAIEADQRRYLAYLLFGGP